MRTEAVEQSGPRCELCGALEADRVAVGRRVLGTLVVAHVDPDVVVLVGPTSRDLLVAPRRHLVRLSTTPDAAAPALCALRVVVGVLRSALGAAGATVEPTLELGGGDHVVFRVVPTATGAGGAAPPGVETVVSLVAGALDPSRRAAPMAPR